jgi:hypothetical protein
MVRMKSVYLRLVDLSHIFFLKKIILAYFALHTDLCELYCHLLGYWNGNKKKRLSPRLYLVNYHSIF